MDGEASAPLPWWQRLPEDFHRQQSGTALDATHPLSVRGGAAMDYALRTGLGCVMAGLRGGAFWRDRPFQRQRELLRFYARFADGADPEAVFPAPKGDVRVRRARIPRRMFKPAGIPSELLSFDSGYKPLCPDMAGSYARHRRNRVAHAQYWRHPGPARPTLIFTHGYFASSYGINSRGFSLPWFYKQGYDIVLYTQPFHGVRRDLTHLYSGQGYAADGLAQMNESIRHAIHDLRVLIDFLQTEGAPHIGAAGLSMGGYLTALLAAIDDRLAFAIPIAPGVTLFDMLLEWQPIGALLKRAMRRSGASVPEMRRGMAFHSPLTYPPKISAERLMIIGGAGDRFTLPDYVRQLHEHWRGSRMHWFPGGHITHVQQADYLRMMKAFMDRHVGF